jgi:N-methylhydantoinase A/oxoprolinase/acetone carboxylase beta subunit
LTGLTDALVIDVGGTSTDVGALAQGFPRESAFGVELGGVQTNFRMPDVVSVALGGGTIIGPAGELGPESVGYRLLEQARTAAEAGDWDRVQALIDSAGRRFGDQPWVKEVLASLEQIAEQRDQARFGKESMYSAMKMRSRVASKDEGQYNSVQEAVMPRFLRRDGSQGTKGSRRQP